MPYSVLARLVHTLFFVTAATTAISKCIDYNIGREMLGATIGPIAWWACAWPLLLCIVILFTMSLAGGRKLVALPWRLGSDGWPLIIVLASASSSARVRELISWPSIFADSMVELSTLVLLLICFGARIVHLHFPDRFGVTSPPAVNP